jgi:hypothetical protein
MAGQPIAAGTTVRKKDRIGEIGPTKNLHVEIRPVAPGTTQTDAAWQARYGNDPPPWTGRVTIPSIPQNSMRMSSAAGSPSREQDKVVSNRCPR